MAREIRYCTTSDGVSIAYAVEGSGPPLLMCQSLAESFALEHLSPRISDWYQMLAAHLTLILYDMRGTGVSQREVTDFTCDALIRDIEAVIAASGCGRTGICAAALAGPRAIAYASLHQDSVTHLILIDTAATPADSAMPRESADALAQLARVNWPLAAQTLSDMGLRAAMDDPARRQEMSELSLAAAQVLERSVSPDRIGDIFRDAFDTWDVSGRLRAITAKTLIVHHQDNILFPMPSARRLAASINGSALVVLEGRTVGATSNVEEMAEIVRKIHALFGVDESPATTEPQPGLINAGTSVILLADVVDSTVLTERLGDALFREKSRQLDTALRERVRVAGGDVIDAKTLGDGILATFPAAARAISAALSFEAAGKDLGLALHVGLHAGDVIREEGNVFGGAVNIAARICALSAPGEILVSDVVRGMGRTSAGVVFEDRGEQVLKGVGEPVRVYAVRAVET